MGKVKVLLADNKEDHRESLGEILKREGYEVLFASNPEQAGKMLWDGKVDIALIDMRLRDDSDPIDRSGLDLIRETKEVKIPKIILTGYPSAEAAREALKPDIEGVPLAIDFISKDQGPDAVLEALARAQLLTIKHTVTRKGFKVNRITWLTLALVSLLLGAGVGIVTLILENAWWLLGTIMLFILAVVFYGFSEFQR